MLSRVADSMFWMNRYMERAEGLLRVLLTNYVLSLDKGSYDVYSWRPVLETFGQLSNDEIKELEHSSANTRASCHFRYNILFSFIDRFTHFIRVPART